MAKTRQLKFGLVAFAASLGQVALPAHFITPAFISLSWLLNWIGLILICDYITQRLTGKSLRRTIHHSRSNSVNFVVASVLGGALVEGIGQWLGKLWFYPYFSTPEYFLVCVPGFALYMLMIAECYLAAKAIVDKVIKPRKVSRKYYPFERKVYRNLGVVGGLAVAVGLVLALAEYGNGYAFKVNAPYGIHMSFIGILLIICGVWWISERVEYNRRETSLLKDLIHAYWNPLIAIITATGVIGVSMEVINLRHEYWVYANWPLQGIHVFGLPIIMIAIAWPVHFIMFLSLFRAITAKDSAEVWQSPSALKRKPKSKRLRLATGKAG